MNWSGSKGGGAQGSDQNGGDNGWQQWRGKRATAMGAQDGGHTVKIANYWQPLQQTGTPAVHPREQRLWGADEDPFVPIRNGLDGNKGRQPAPSRGVSQRATWGDHPCKPWGPALAGMEIGESVGCQQPWGACRHGTSRQLLSPPSPHVALWLTPLLGAGCRPLLPSRPFRIGTRGSSSAPRSLCSLGCTAGVSVCCSGCQ